MLLNFRRFLIGNPIETDQMAEEKLTKTTGLAVLSSDALSSTAYATEEILKVVALTGAVGLAFTVPISIAIVALIGIVGFSYYRTIFAYPTGGGAYIVAKENLGINYGLVAAAALLVDYLLTVAVSISAGVEAITSAFPNMLPYSIEIALVFVSFITIVNLRGIRDSGKFFAIPTYAFLLVYGGMIVFGFYKIMSGALPPHAPLSFADNPHLKTLSVFLVLRAFASGASALTGIEAVSNGVQAFKAPQSLNASRVLILMVSLLAVFFLGTSFLANYMGVLPSETETVVSQIARGLFGTNMIYYGIQFVTVMILILAANTAYTDFPRLSSLLAQDRYLPRQLASLGDRLVFSNGILFLGIFVGILVIIFKASTHLLIPLYMIGVFITFTLSQAGMVKHWYDDHCKGWWMKAAINGFGSIITLVVGVIVFIVKFSEGAWMTILCILSVILVMRAIHKHYEEFKVQISIDNAKAPKPFESHKVVIPISDIHRGVLEAVRYARTISNDVKALYVDLGNEGRMAALKKEWEKWVPDVPLEILPSPYRSVIAPIVDYIDAFRTNENMDTAVTVVIPEFVPVKWWHHLLHNQTALGLRFALLYRRGLSKRYKVLADVPYYLRR